MSTDSQHEFLQTVRRSLGRPGPTPPIDVERLFGPVESRGGPVSLESRAESLTGNELRILIDRFEKELTLVQGQVARIGSREALEPYLRDLVESHKVKKVVRWDTPLLAELDPFLQGLGVSVTPIKAARKGQRNSKRLRNALIEADLGLTEADYAIADTGTLVLLARGNQSRLVSVLPPIHLALLRPETLVPSMSDLLPVLGAEARGKDGKMSSAVTFITGPSRTADIETIRVVGIHGPIELHAAILEYL